MRTAGATRRRDISQGQRDVLLRSGLWDGGSRRLAAASLRPPVCQTPVWLGRLDT
jgi:hypothetical protein